MNIIRGIENFSRLEESHPYVFGLGNFDGVHKGHQFLIKRMVDYGNEHGLKKALLLFYPHPRKVTRDKSYRVLMPFREKIQKLETLGIQVVVLQRFTEIFAHLMPDKFVKTILHDVLGARSVFVGYDYRFGYGRCGTSHDLAELGGGLGMSVVIIPAQKLNDLLISSSTIRHALHRGEVEKVNQMLGYLYKMRGRVVRGDGRGKRLGYPTANLKLPRVMIPRNGVYAVTVRIEGIEYLGVCNIGNRPTFASGGLVVEVHIFDFDMDIYGQPMEVYFHHWIREERNLETEELLRRQIEIDLCLARTLMENTYAYCA